MDQKIGLEIHVYIDIENRKKLFCNCDINPDSTANTDICPVCTGQPGAKPMPPNIYAVKKILRTALMLGCRINDDLVWQRKHYDWPDLPKGYQNTMSGSYAFPVGENGEFLGIRIREIHLEEDPARWDPVTGCVDYNRSGYPLMEIVTEPDFNSKYQVRGWLKNLMTLLGYIDAVNKGMGVKCDVNVSIAPEFNRVEIKNVNSFKSIINAIDYETERQKKAAEKGERIGQETRAWADAEGITKFMRSKEEALDYMFIPDPDLPVVEISKGLLDEISVDLPERPGVKEEKLLKAGVEKTTAKVLSQDIYLAELFERLAKEVDPIAAAKWMRKELMRILNLMEKDYAELGINESRIVELLSLLRQKKITEQIGREILSKLAEKDFSPKEYVEERGLESVSDSAELEKICSEAIAENPKAVDDIRNGIEKSINFLVGQVMKKSKGKAMPNEVKEIVKRLVS